MAYDAKAVANYFLDLAKKDGTSITPMKLQKLIFFAHGWHLALAGEPLIADQVEAWQFGPVVPAIYHEFKHERSGAITCKATELDLESFSMVELSVAEDDLTAKKIMERIWDTFGKLSAKRLSDLTHLPGTPWDLAIKSSSGSERGVPILDAEIDRYFSEQLRKNRAAHEQKS